MTAVGWLPVSVEDLFGPEATAEESYEVLTVDVPPANWTEALRTARDELGCTYFDWLSAVDEPGTGLRVSAHVVALAPVRRLLVRTTVPHGTPALASAVEIYAGAAWHERETHEMFGITFEGHPALDHLLLPEGFEGHPLRKDFVLAARVAKAWPGAKEPGESDHGGPKRRQMLPPGVPDPNEWGPLKGQLPPAPARPARGAGRAAGERPVRRTRAAAEGSASQAPAAAEATEAAPAPRRARTVSEGSASQRGAEADTSSAAPAGPRRARSASQGSASQRAGSDDGATAGPPDPSSPTESSSPTVSSSPTDSAPSPDSTASPSGARRSRSASGGSASQRAAAPAAADDADTGADRKPPTAPHSADAPWHHARPAFDDPARPAKPESAPEAGAPDKQPHPGEETTQNDPAPHDPASQEPTPGEPTPEEDPAPEDPTPDDPTGGTQ